MSNYSSVNQAPCSDTSTSSTIYINPRFRNAHINPNFLPRSQLPPAAQPFNIHINPLFLAARPTFATVQHDTSQPPAPRLERSTIISQTSRKLVRKPIVHSAKVIPRAETPNKPPLIKIGQRKLVRVGLPTRPAIVAERVVFFRKTPYTIDRRNRLNGHRISNATLKSTRVVKTNRKMSRMYDNMSFFFIFAYLMPLFFPVATHITTRWNSGGIH